MSRTDRPGPIAVIERPVPRQQRCVVGKVKSMAHPRMCRGIAGIDVRMRTQAALGLACALHTLRVPTPGPNKMIPLE